MFCLHQRVAYSFSQIFDIAVNFHNFQFFVLKLDFFYYFFNGRLDFKFQFSFSSVKSVMSNWWRRFSPLNLVIIQFNEHFIETFLDQGFWFWYHIFWKFTTKFSINVLKILSYQKFKSVSSDIIFALFLLNPVDPVFKPL